MTDNEIDSTREPETLSPREALVAKLRAHATARLRGDTAEADRIAAGLEPQQRMSHLLFQVTFFTAVVVDRLGGRPDPEDLAALTKRLHDKHYKTGSSFNALRSEAMIRAIVGESELLTEIPTSEQTGYLWAVVCELIDPAIDDADLAEFFAFAEESGSAKVFDAFGDQIMKPLPPRAPEPERSSEPQGPPAATDEEGVTA